MPASLLDRARLLAGLAAAVALIGSGLTAEGGISDGRWLALLGLGWLAATIAIWPRLPGESRPFARAAARTAFILMSLFGLLTVQLVRIQAIDQQEIANRTGGNAATGDTLQNPRTVNIALAANRGSIYDRNGNLIAGVQVVDGVGYRTYPDPNTAYVAGYYAPLQYGLSGLELAYDEALSGRTGANAVTDELNRLLHRTSQGSDLRLTLDSALQDQAHQLLGDRTGAVVLLDVKTGATLVLASAPHYNPAALVAATTGERDQAAQAWAGLVADPSRPLVLRATSGLYTPGSTFKTVTAAAAIEHGVASPTTVYEDNGAITIDGRELIEQNRPDPSVDQWTLTQGYAFSLNVVFAQVGLAVGPDRLRAMAEAFGFGSAAPYDLPVARSSVANSPNFLQSQAALAETAFGQGQLQATPLEMALVAACVANGGTMMRPYLVDRIIDKDGRVVATADKGSWRHPVSSATATTLQHLMVNAVEQGYVSGAQIPGYIVGGKTGTAETGDGGNPHAWFIGFIGDPEPRYAVAVVLEHGADGTGSAVSIGREMLAAAIASGTR